MSDRFKFGENWAAFLSQVNEERIGQAISSLQKALDVETLEGQRILDIGSGSGLFSLAAHRLGAEVVSFDYDESSVECTRTLKSKFGNDSKPWSVSQGSVLDEDYMTSLGKFNGVYSWGVLHHTGEMDKAIELASQCVEDSGWFFIAIYNDQGHASKRWLATKVIYNKLPEKIQPVYVVAVAGLCELNLIAKRVLSFKNPFPGRTPEQKNRGMTKWYDWVDWIGGLPFEVGSPEKITMMLRKKGFLLDHLITIGKGHGCNEFVFHLDESKRKL